MKFDRSGSDVAHLRAGGSAFVSLSLLVAGKKLKAHTALVLNGWQMLSRFGSRDRFAAMEAHIKSAIE